MKNFAIIFALLLLAKWWFTDPSITVPTNNVTFSYIVKYTEASKKNVLLPTIIALHGNGDTTNNFYETALDQLTVPTRIILLEGPISMGTGYAWPWKPEGFNQYGKAINEAIKLLTIKYPTKKKPVLVGFSGGASMAFYQAVKHGNSYSYIFPISGDLTNDLLGDNSFSPGAEVIAYNGTTDKLVSVSEGRKAVEILKSKGIHVSLTEFNGGHHGIFTSMKTKITNAIEKKILSLN